MEEKQNKNLQKHSVVMETNSFFKIGSDNKKIVNWDKAKISFFLSPYRNARTFLVGEKIFTEHEANHSGWISTKIVGWEMEKKDWEKQALETTMHNLRETKAVELQDFIKQESRVVQQLLNMAKIAMNNLLNKRKDRTTGKDILELKNTLGFKQVSESTLSILKYSREKLGIPFDKEEKGLANAINFNFDLVNLDEFDSNKVMDLFKKKDAEQTNSKPNKGRVISAVSKTVKD